MKVELVTNFKLQATKILAGLHFILTSNHWLVDEQPYDCRLSLYFDISVQRAKDFSVPEL